jgi:hypothetical protein
MTMTTVRARGRHPAPMTPLADNEAAAEKASIFIGTNDFVVPQYDVFPCASLAVLFH